MARILFVRSKAERGGSEADVEARPAARAGVAVEVEAVPGVER
jgi:hypothetical protein